MKKILLQLTFLIATALLIPGCTTQQEDEKITEQTENEIDRQIMTRSGGTANANNPYSLQNVQQAARQIINTTIDLEPTHRYVRFLPADTLQAFTLDSLRLDLFEYPIDRMLNDDEIVVYEEGFNDDNFNWLYTSIPVDFNYPENIECEILDDLYMQGAPGTRTTPFSLTEEQWNDVIDRAMINTGNGGGDEPQTRGLEWMPSATITYTDNRTNQQEPMPGLRIRVHHFTNVGYGSPMRAGRPEEYPAELENLKMR